MIDFLVSIIVAIFAVGFQLTLIIVKAGLSVFVALISALWSVLTSVMSKGRRR